MVNQLTPKSAVKVDIWCILMIFWEDELKMFYLTMVDAGGG